MAVLHCITESYDCYCRNSALPRKYGRSQGFETPAAVSVRPVPAALRQQKSHAAQASSAQPEAFQKIQALETELLKLQAQIAMIVTTPTGKRPLTNELTFHDVMYALKWRFRANCLLYITLHNLGS